MEVYIGIFCTLLGVVITCVVAYKINANNHQKTAHTELYHKFSVTSIGVTVSDDKCEALGLWLGVARRRIFASHPTTLTPKHLKKLLLLTVYNGHSAKDMLVCLHPKTIYNIIYSSSPMTNAVVTELIRKEWLRKQGVTSEN